MDFFVMRLPETGGVGVVPETAVEHHRERGWIRVSDALSRDEHDQLRPESYVDALDLDAEPESKPAKGQRSGNKEKE
jgi:hypothetical protein